MDFRRHGWPPELQMTNQLKVLYIAGSGRSGSTILQNMLGEIEGFQPLGELCSIGHRYLEKHRCGCGEPLDACGHWKAILNRAFGRFDRPAAHQLHRKLRIMRTRHLPVLLTSPGRPAGVGENRRVAVSHQAPLRRGARADGMQSVDRLFKRSAVRLSSDSGEID